MGFIGLWNKLEAVRTEVDMIKYKGKVVAVDAMIFMYICVQSCAKELVTGVHTTK